MGEIVITTAKEAYTLTYQDEKVDGQLSPNEGKAASQAIEDWKVQHPNVSIGDTITVNEGVMKIWDQSYDRLKGCTAYFFRCDPIFFGLKIDSDYLPTRNEINSKIANGGTYTLPIINDGKSFSVMERMVRHDKGEQEMKRFKAIVSKMSKEKEIRDHDRFTAAVLAKNKISTEDAAIVVHWMNKYLVMMKGIDSGFYEPDALLKSIATDGGTYPLPNIRKDEDAKAKAIIEVTSSGSGREARKKDWKLFGGLLSRTFPGNAAPELSRPLFEGMLQDKVFKEHCQKSFLCGKDPEKYLADGLARLSNWIGNVTDKLGLDNLAELKKGNK